MKFLKNLANRIQDFSFRFTKQIGYLLGSIIGISIGFFITFRLTGLEVVAHIEHKEILLQGILVASTALIGVTGVFMAAIRFSVAGKLTPKISSISRLLIKTSLLTGLITILYAVYWCVDSKDIWIIASSIVFFIQVMTFTFSIFPLFRIFEESI